MRLRAIDLHGYKSFAARTALQFDAPLTAIVGPNGSGKSNVMDALRWAIGAGSGRALRTKRAEDVVFSGGRDRAPSGFAEVRLLLDNSDQWLPLDAAEVEIVRRIHRDGQSEVRINGRAARLRDVQDLFRSSGLGAGGFALMSQGLVDEMLRLRPHERRQAIEEVGGVRQHRHQMEESRRRRERAQEHLVRARLLRDELAPRLKTLERAARRARRRIDLQSQLDAASRRYFRAALAELNGELLSRSETAAAASEARTAAERRREDATADLARVERETAAARRSVAEAAEQIRIARSQLRTLEHQQELDQQQRSWLSREVAALASRIPGERSAGAADLETAQRELADVNRQLNAARSERDQRERARTTAAAQRDRAAAEIESVLAQAIQLSRRWRANDAQRRISVQDERAAERARRLAEAGLREAQTALERAEREQSSAREARERQRAERARLADRLEEIDAQIAALERRDEHADTLRALVRRRVDDPVRADALFGELLDASLHDSLDQAIAAVQHIIDADAGRGTALVRDRAAELIDALIASVDFVDDLDSAKRAAAAGRIGVTAAGVVVRADGLVQAGGSLPGERRRRRQLAELKSERDDCRRRLSAVESAAETRSASDDLEIAVSRAQSVLDLARRTAAQSALTAETARRRRASAITRLRADRAESRRLRERLQESRRVERQSAQQLAALPPPVADDLAALEQERDRRAAALADARAQAAAADRVRADRARLFSLKRELADVETAIREREPQLEQAAPAASATEAHEQSQTQLRTLERERTAAAAALEQAQQARVDAERRDVEAAAALRETESARARLAAEAAAEGIDLNAVDRESQPSLELNGFGPTARRSSNGANGRSPRQSSAAVAVAEPAVSELQETVLDLRAKLQRLGPVDPGAAHEFAAEQTRWQHMETQIADLEATESALRQAEHDLEALIERKFREACRQVDEAFRRYFQIMFRGGQAELVLTEEAATGDDEAESTRERPRLGVDIRAQPPGKRVSTLGLLSGGERALTAIALLFALLEIRPAPFCILDEVDAALDEANVERFVAALKDRARETQFVVITHNRRTIEQADSIYGVTMGAAGVSRLLSVRVDQLPAAAS